MPLAATSPAEGHALIERDVAAEGSGPGPACFLCSSDSLRHGCGSRTPQVVAALDQQLRVRELRSDAMIAAGEVVAWFLELVQVSGHSSHRNVALPDQEVVIAVPLARP